MQFPPVSQLISDVVAFVDWNAQLLLSGKDCEADPLGAAEGALKHTARRIAKCLTSIDPSRRFRVSLRLYHGWHKGFEPTVNRKAARLTIAKTDFAVLSPKPNVIISQQVDFGDHLLYASAERLLAKLDCHLPNTLRNRHGSEIEEKMVDTALAADVVSSAYKDGKSWILVVTEDDDLIPPVYAAEFALAGTAVKAIILRKKVRASMLSLDGILING